ncbi:MAG: hypothetical protein ACPHCN_11880, partial [Mycobacterium sp.]
MKNKRTTAALCALLLAIPAASRAAENDIFHQIEKGGDFKPRRLADPDIDSVSMWDDSAGEMIWTTILDGITLTGSTLNFTDPDSNWTATQVGTALAELDDVINGGAPNAASGKVDWSQLVNVPAGFADGDDDGGGGDFLADGSVPMTGELDMNAQRVGNTGRIYPRTQGEHSLGTSSRGWSELWFPVTKLTYDAAGVLAQRNGTNAQTFRFYGTYTDASNYERGSISVDVDGNLILAAEAAGTGTAGWVQVNSPLKTNSYVSIDGMTVHGTRGMYRGSHSNNQVYPRQNGLLTLLSGQVDGPGNVGTVIETSNTLSNATAELLAVRNGGVDVFNILANGDADLNGNLYLDGINQTSSSAADPSTTEYPIDGDWGVHENTTSGNFFLAYNDGGVMVNTLLGSGGGGSDGDGLAVSDLAGGTALSLETLHTDTVTTVGGRTIDALPAATEGARTQLWFDVTGAGSALVDLHTNNTIYRADDTAELAASLRFPVGVSHWISLRYLDGAWRLLDTSVAIETPETLYLANGAGIPEWANLTAGHVPDDLIDSQHYAAGSIDAGHLAVGAQTDCWIIAISDETSDLTAGAGKVTFLAPYAATITGVRSSVTTAPTGATLTIDINDGGTSIMTTDKLDILTTATSDDATAALTDTA